MTIEIINTAPEQVELITQGVPSRIDVIYEDNIAAIDVIIITGERGLPGLNGIDGKDGVNGKSAYQIWVDAGNTGTEADFLESLKGRDGVGGSANIDDTAPALDKVYSSKKTQDGLDGKVDKIAGKGLSTEDFTTGEKNNLSIAYGWGNHASAGYLTSASPLAWGKLTGKPTTLSGYGITDNITIQGNNFNGASQLVMLDATGKLPAVDGSRLTGLPVALPSMAGNNGKWLTTNGTEAAWAFNTGWSTTGNSGTDGGAANFIGTTDNKDLYFKRNNVTSFYIDVNNIAQFKSDATYGGGSGVKFSSGGGSPYIQSLGSPGLAFKNSAGVIWMNGADGLGNNLNIGASISTLSFFNYSPFTFSIMSGGTISRIIGSPYAGTGSNFFDIVSAGYGSGKNTDLRIYTSTNAGAYGNVILAYNGSAATGRVGVGIANPDVSAFVDISSTSKGFLLPRMNTSQVAAISAPAEGLQAYDIQIHSLKLHDGTVWNNIVHSNISNTKVTGTPTPDGYFELTIGGSKIKFLTTS